MHGERPGGWTRPLAIWPISFCIYGAEIKKLYDSDRIDGVSAGQSGNANLAREREKREREKERKREAFCMPEA